MSLNKLKRQFEERRLNLIETLQKSKDGLELSKQHQLYGAIKEIEAFLKAIDYHHEQSLSGADFELKRDKPEPIKTRASMAMQSAGGKAKGFFASVVIEAPKKAVRSTGRAFKGMGRKVRMYKEVMREVKHRSTEKKDPDQMKE